MPAAMSAIEHAGLGRLVRRAGDRQEARTRSGSAGRRPSCRDTDPSVAVAGDVADDQPRVHRRAAPRTTGPAARRRRARGSAPARRRVASSRASTSRAPRVLDVERQALLRAVDPDEVRGQAAARVRRRRARSRRRPGRSTLITRAPRSASWRVQNGAAIACSSVTTVMPSRGRIGMLHQNDRGRPSTCSAT